MTQQNIYNSVKFNSVLYYSCAGTTATMTIAQTAEENKLYTRIQSEH